MLGNKPLWLGLMLGCGFAFQATAVPPAHFVCGKTRVIANFHGEKALSLIINDVKHELVLVVSGSGAKYETPVGMKPFVMFWNKGAEATIEVAGKTLPLCHQQDAAYPKPTAILEQEWLVEALNQKGVIDAKLTVMFKKDGKLAGFSGCNRFGGSYQLEGEKLIIKDSLFSTKMACVKDELMEQESRYLTLLPSMTHATLTKEGKLLLSNNKKQTIRAKLKS